MILRRVLHMDSIAVHLSVSGFCRPTLDRLSADVGPYRRSVADGQRLGAERVRRSFDEVSDLQPSLPAAPHVHRHHFADSCSHTDRHKETSAASSPCVCVCVCVCVCGRKARVHYTLNGSGGLVDDPVALQLSVRGERRSPGHVDAPPRHLGEGQEARHAGSCGTHATLNNTPKSRRIYTAVRTQTISCFA